MHRRVINLVRAFVFAFLCTSPSAFAQKPALDFAAQKTWPRLTEPVMSNDGQYVAYTTDVPASGTTLTVQALDHPLQRTFSRASGARFTEDSRYLVFQIGTDSVGLVSLADDRIEYLAPTGGVEIPPESDGQWLAYQLKDSARTLVVRNLRTGAERRYAGVASAQFSRDGRVLLMQLAPSRALVWLTVDEGRGVTVSHAMTFSQFMFNQAQSGVAFLAQDSVGGEERTTLRYYASGMDSAQVVVDPRTVAGMGDLVVSGVVQFGHDGRELTFELDQRRPAQPSVDTSGAQVKLMDSHDPEDNPWHHLPSRLGVVHLGQTPRVLLLDDPGEGYQAVSPDGAYALIYSNAIGSALDYMWHVKARPDVYLVSTGDGSRTLVTRRLVSNGDELAFSPSGKYVIWFDRQHGGWYTYDIARKITHAITSGANASWYEAEDHADLPFALRGSAWTDRDAKVLVHSRYDIWALDPEGKTAPIDLTHGVGEREGIRLRWLDFPWDQSRTLQSGDTLLLEATDGRTYDTGFYRLILSGAGQLTKLIMGPKAYHRATCPACGYVGAYADTRPLKARLARRYLLSVQSATEYPNYYVTSDFHQLTPITHLAPQAAYNWYRAELHHFRLPDGRTATGVLYKPENFDPRKKYPVIFFYYEKSSGGVNYLMHPELSRGPMDVPWFVSNGYLVFVPDIYYTVGHPGRSALNSVLAGAQYLSRFPWVNAKKMGLQGQSYAGFETYYIISHTTRFAAAAPSAGTTDEVASYGQLHFGTANWYERRQGRMGASLYDRPDLYIENSAVFGAKRVTTPLLILANWEPDGIVPGSQGGEMFVAMRRLGKPAWLLDYEGEGHALDQTKDQLDYSIRLGQFFGYYLKDELPPKWMTHTLSSPPRETGIGLELDRSGARP